MDRKTLIILLAICIIIVCLVFGVNDNKVENNEIEEQKSSVNLNYNQIVDNTTGEAYYQIYNKDTGDVVANVMEEKDIQIYLDDPDYQGIEEDAMYETVNVVETKLEAE